MARQGIAFVPTVLVLPYICSALGAGALTGLELSQATADVVAFMIALPIGIGELRRLKKAAAEQQTTEF